MKKMNFYKVMMMAVVALCSISLTACGGDDDDDLTPPSTQTGTGGGEVKNNLTFAIPCLDWTADHDKVRAFMTDSEWALETNANYLVYENAARTEILYQFGDETHTLISATVTYKDATWDIWEWVKQEVTKKYNVTLKVEEYKDAGSAAAGATYTEGTAKNELVLMKLGTQITVKWMPATD